MKMAENSPKWETTRGEKEKLLVTSIFSFSCSFFERLVLQTSKNQGLFWKGLKILKTLNIEMVLNFKDTQHRNGISIMLVMFRADNKPHLYYTIPTFYNSEKIAF